MEPAISRFTIGSFECIAVSDGTLSLPATNLFFNAPENELARSLAEYGITDSRVNLPFNPLVLRANGITVLVDSGYGPGVAPTLGHIVENLADAGIAATDIDIVLFSHGHADHTGGAVTESGLPAFPNARVLLSQNEVAFWQSAEADAKDAPRAKAARRIFGALRNRLESVEPGQEVIPGVSVVSAGGHTPSNTAIRVESDGQTLLYVADAVAHPIHLQHPDWYLQADLDPAAAVAARVASLRQAQAEHAVLSGYHLPLPGIIRVKEEPDGRWSYQAI